MDLAALLEDSGDLTKFYDYRPFGHPDTFEGGRIYVKNNWSPWTHKPWQLEFHNAGKDNYHRAILGANGVGKSVAPSWETALHATGDYKNFPWFDGFKFDKPAKIWVGAIDAEQQRQGVQAHLLGPNLGEGLGTGFIPKDRIVGKVRTRQAGMSDVADQVQIRHNSGGVSTLIFKTYQQGWRSWQAAAPNVVQLDEEPDENDAKQSGVFSEAVTRVVRSGGIIYCGLTPLLGETDLTRHFMDARVPRVWWIGATWEDVPHMSEDAKATAMASYSDHEKDARTKGIPMMGEGRILKFREEDIKVPQREVPNYYTRICGMDFGVGAKHPAAAAWLAHDRDQDIVYLYDEYRQERDDAIIHAEAVKSRGDWIPVAWPHDGHKTSDLTKANADGAEIKDIYARYGLNMLPISARYERDRGGAQPQWPIIQKLQDRMELGRFKVMDNCHLFFEEARSFHVKDGKIVNRREDLLKAVFYALMMLDYAHAKPAFQQARHVPMGLRL